MRDSISCWQKILADGFSSSTELLTFLQLPINAGSLHAEKQFKTRVPRGFAALMEQGNRFDPLLLQVLAVDDELVENNDFVTDPLAEAAVNPLKGLIHKYHGRVLLTVTGSCSIHCRYCFRRHFPYEDNNPGRKGWQPVLNYIMNDSSIHEVILSGGDPLLAKDSVLLELLLQLNSIPHLTTLRIHTRMPIALPERVNDDLIQCLNTSRLHKIVVLHSNHPNELDKRVEHACHMLKKANCHLLNQSVLLKQVNDDAAVLALLSHRLFACGVLPYYLHVLDKVKGASHFDIPQETAVSLFKTLQRMLPGYLVPRLVRDEVGKQSKTLLCN